MHLGTLATLTMEFIAYPTGDKMDINSQRQLNDLFESVVRKLATAHSDAVQEVVKVFPEVKEDLEEDHRRYCQKLRDRLARAKQSLTKNDEPLWLLLTTLHAELYFDVGTNMNAYDQIMRRLGLPIPDRDY